MVTYYRLSRDKIKFRVLSSQTGHIIKDRVLTAPATYNYFSGLQANANQVVVTIIQQGDYPEVLLVYDMESLLSETADQDITPRVVKIGQPGYRVLRIALNKTSVSVLLESYGDVKTLKFTTLDFWICENGA